MDRNTLSLIGVVDTLKHVLENDESSKKDKKLRAASKRMESIRKELLTEGLRYAKVVGAARDSIFDISMQLQGHLAETRGMQWIISGLLTVNIEDVQPPPPPSSSSYGPKSVAPEVLQLAQRLTEITAAYSETAIQSAGVNRVAKIEAAGANLKKNGQGTGKVIRVLLEKIVRTTDTKEAG